MIIIIIMTIINNDIIAPTAMKTIVIEPLLVVGTTGLPSHSVIITLFNHKNTYS